MPVPAFNHNLTLPPYQGNPANPADLSPYPATSIEVCQELGNTPERRTILAGWLAMREAMHQIGFNNGFQWLDGSFMEDIETAAGRPPNDIDVVTFATLPVVPVPIVPGSPTEILRSRQLTRQHHHVDHLLVGLQWPAATIIEWTRYYCGLFSHRRVDGVWKGMVRVQLISPGDDAQASAILVAAAAAAPPAPAAAAPPAAVAVANPVNP